MNYFSKNLVSEGTRNYFDLGSNLVPYFEFGTEPGQDLWLEGSLAGPDEEFIFNGRLYLPGQSSAGTIIDNFPQGQTPKGWMIHKLVDREGYELLHPVTRETLFGYEVAANTCRVTVNLYTASGVLAARATADGLEIVRGTKIDLRLGRHGVLCAA